MIQNSFDAAPDEHEVDIVIIGAGMAGLYCAMSLADKHPERRITIVERLNRWGGRLQTDLVTVKPGQVVREEEGGMRFNYTMTELMSLNAELDLCGEIVPFPMSSPANTNRVHVRGQTFTVAEAERGSNSIWGELFDLNESERGRSPHELIIGAFDRVRKANNDTVEHDRKPDGPGGWCEVREKWTWKGQTLNQWQMWGLLRDMGYSEEAIQLMAEMNGFMGLFKAPTNAGEAFQVLGDFPADPRLFTFKDGFSTLPNAIVKRLEATYSDRVTILLSTNVDQIVRDGERFSIDLTAAPENQNSNPWVDGGKKKTVFADDVIVAVASSGMERLFQRSPALHDQPEAKKLWENIQATRGMKLMKINLYFDSPWWDQTAGPVTPPLQFGPSFTSLPISAVYPFYALPSKEAPPTSADEPIDTAAAAALTIYCDFNNTNFWAGLQNLEPKFTSELQTAHNEAAPQTIYGASQPVVDEILKQLRVLFSTDAIPDPVMTSYRLWDGTNDFEHAYHQWRVGVIDSEVRGYLANPIDGIYFCNEAISDMQGWVNGSLRSANDVLCLDVFDSKPDIKDPCVAPAEHDDVGAAPTKQLHVSGLWGA